MISKYEYTKDLPEKPLGSELVPYATPLHVRDLILQLLQEAFGGFPEGHPYRYLPDDFQNTGIFFDVSHNKESNIFGHKPVVIVNLEQQSTRPAVISDLSIGQLGRGAFGGSTLVAAVVSLKAVGKIRAELEVIAQLIFGILTTYRTSLPGILGVHSLDQITLSGATRFDQDDAMYVVQVNVEFQMQYKWQNYREGDQLAKVSFEVGHEAGGNI